MINLNDLSNQVVENLEPILSSFGIEYVNRNDRLAFPCPIHGSDNTESLSVYLSGHTTKGYWRCFTGACEEELVEDTLKNGDKIKRPLGSNIFGLIRGILSAQLDRHVEYSEAIAWCKKFLNITDDSKAPQPKVDLELKQFVTSTRILNKDRKQNDFSVTKEMIRGSLEIPSQYYIARGYGKEILDKYDIGYCSNKYKPMYDRAVVPIYDDDYRFMVGCAGRSIYEKCDLCELYHHLNHSCPTSEDAWKYKKWRFSSGFYAGSYLYNYWFARESIQETGIAILVEGPGDVWRIEEAGIKNSVAIFGISLSAEQQLILDSSGAMNIVVLMDNDERGKPAREKIAEKLSRAYNCTFIDLPKKDIGDTPIEDVKRLLNPVLEKFNGTKDSDSEW